MTANLLTGGNQAWNAASPRSDVVGYSRLMEADEEATARTLSTCRENIEGLVASHHGRGFGSAGDSFIAEFASPIEAVRCAVNIQRELEAHNVDLPEDRRMRLRIGVNLGDVMVEGDNLLGDGVNIAARLETLADPGGISLARSVFDQVRKQLDLGYEYLGEHEVKNIAEPVQVYRVLTEPEAAGTVIGEAKPAPQSWKRVAVAAVVVVLIGVAGAVTWLRPWEPTTEPASVERMAFPLPDKPSIAVLPFVNMSGDPEQEYFADGMAEDLITDLSKISGLFVISRNSAFTYKGKTVKVRQVAEELGVRYVLEGSVRRAGDEVRINAQLIDATTGGHLWAERYDGTLEDIFDLQDKVTEQIVAALAVSLTGEELAQQTRHATENAAAHDAYLQGWARYKLLTPKDLAEAVPFFEEALRLDPGYAQAHAALAALYWDAYVNDWAFDLDMPSSRAENRANEHLEKALETPTPLAHALQARMMASWGFHDAAVVEAEQAVALDANDAAAHAGLAEALVFAGKPAKAIDAIEIAMRLDPHHPPSYLITLGAAQFGTERYEDAAATFERAVKRNPDNEIPLIYLASAYGHLGRIEDADDVINEANDLRNLQGLGELSLRDTTTYAMEMRNTQTDFTRFGSKPVQDLVRAGLVDIPELKWQYLLTIHSTLGLGVNTWWEVEGATLIDISTAKLFHDRGVIFIDVSGQSMWITGHIPGAVHLSWERSGDPSRARFTKATLREVAQYDDEIVLYFDDGSVASAAWEAAKAVTWGYRKVYLFGGGAQAWKAAGYPVETGE
jgi:TolB-like protein/class 3 adenylate cyclase/3-mercaptopyruvate sulfurtransferase SseA